MQFATEKTDPEWRRSRGLVRGVGNSITTVPLVLNPQCEGNDNVDLAEIFIYLYIQSSNRWQFTIRLDNWQRRNNYDLTRPVLGYTSLEWPETDGRATVACHVVVGELGVQGAVFVAYSV